MQRLEFARRALADLDEIYLHGLTQFGRQQADDYADMLDSALRLICEYPAIGTPLGKRPDAMRRRSAGVHSIVYIADPDCIRIVRVLHQHMDADRHV